MRFCCVLSLQMLTAKLHELEKRLGVVFSARVHPGETSSREIILIFGRVFSKIFVSLLSVSSWIRHGIIEF